MKSIYNSLYLFTKPWTEKGNIKFISDTHFDDEDMNWRNISPIEIVDKINSALYAGDTLVHLGDVGDPSYLKRIKHKIRLILIKGNHDCGSSIYENYFDEIYSGPLFISDKILLSHEPILIPGINFHGHDHYNAGYADNKMINCCCEGINYIPISLKDFIINGGLKKVDNIHRLTIDDATRRHI